MEGKVLMLIWTILASPASAVDSRNSLSVAQTSTVVETTVCKAIRESRHLKLKKEELIRVPMHPSFGSPAAVVEVTVECWPIPAAK